MRRLVVSVGLVVALAGLAWSADIDRHASFSEPNNANASQCKGFYGTDDNLTACNDFCTQFRTDNQGAPCKCDEGKCATDDSH
jgi:hypothetical protein